MTKKRSQRIQFNKPEVAVVFAEYPESILNKLLELREIIFDTAKQNPEIGPIEETLKWGQPSYLPLQTHSGTTIRIDKIKHTENEYAIYVPCSTTLINDFKEKFGTNFSYEKNRAIHFTVHDSLPKKEIKMLIKMALTYHLNKK